MVTAFPKSHFVSFKPAIFIPAISHLTLQQWWCAGCVQAQHRFIFSALAQLHSVHSGGWRMQMALSCCAHNPGTSRQCLASSSCGAFLWKHPLREEPHSPCHSRLRATAWAGSDHWCQKWFCGAQFWIHLALTGPLRYKLQIADPRPISAILRNQVGSLQLGKCPVHWFQRKCEIKDLDSS